jgi:hypothetical protein
MNIKQTIISSTAILLVLWASWFFRYDLEVGGDKTFGYLLDRWTGEIELLYGDKRRTLIMKRKATTP